MHLPMYLLKCNQIPLLIALCPVIGATTKSEYCRASDLKAWDSQL
ncbi:hypothetical protein ACIAD0224 [Acinetobacter baylyi ADP1]|uniref:Uncharacterized protein n=1 Tax=Acinetobacter baylyi (strain ATCC 33305 / BD413 / ADP1) TaxID=62977 RepID=Q6FFG5_ACIAD|nr:hypothetical protein ACIAD0224 [Acinetobacter baylyi ADP1]